MSWRRPDSRTRGLNGRPSARASSPSLIRAAVLIGWPQEDGLTPGCVSAYLITSVLAGTRDTIPRILHEFARCGLRLLQVVAGHALDGVTARSVVEFDPQRRALGRRVGAKGSTKHTSRVPNRASTAILEPSARAGSRISRV